MSTLCSPGGEEETSTSCAGGGGHLEGVHSGPALGGGHWRHWTLQPLVYQEGLRPGGKVL